MADVTTEPTPPGSRLDAMLKALPVRPEHAAAVVAIRREADALARDRDAWKRHWELYAASWLRNLGGRIFPKRHRIDALAMTTEHQREGCARAERAGLIGAKYYASDPADAYRRREQEGKGEG